MEGTKIMNRNRGTAFILGMFLLICCFVSPSLAEQAQREWLARYDGPVDMVDYLVSIQKG